jgi:hypothetical protein
LSKLTTVFKAVTGESKNWHFWKPQSSDDEDEIQRVSKLIDSPLTEKFNADT